MAAICGGHLPRGIARSNGLKGSQNAFEIVQIPSGDESFASNVVFECRVGFQNRQRQPSKDRNDFRPVAFANATAVFCKSDIQRVMKCIFDAPVFAKMACVTSHQRRQAADEVRRFGLYRAIAENARAVHSPDGFQAGSLLS